jgi:hypothetical protein
MAGNVQVDWVLIVFVLFKGLVFIASMVFAIKWHYDKERKKGADARALLRMGGKLGAIFVLLLVVLLAFTFGLARMLGMDLSLP